MGQTIRLTIELAAVTTGVLLVLGIPLAWWLVRTRSRWRSVVSSLVALPLVLPPTVLGFYLLLAMSPTGPFSGAMRVLGVESLAFTFEGLVLGSVIYSLPFVVQPIRDAFEAIGERPLEVAATLHASPLDAFFSVALPLARPGIVNGAVLGFAHTLGEFGVVLMIGGSIPGETRVVSIAIYEHVEAMEWSQAHWLSSGMLVFSFLVILLVNVLERRTRRRDA